MVLRSGIIIPFQFRDNKKLLMIGGPEENRLLSIWDLKNVVRAAFGIYNFEFRNKKIGFNIPDELLLQYLAQRHDLTNFVIEIGPAFDVEGSPKEATLSYEPSCSQKQQQQQQQHQLIVSTTPLRSRESPRIVQPVQNYATSLIRGTKSPAQNETTNVMSAGIGNNSNQAASPPMATPSPPQKIRISNVFSEPTPESLTQSIDPMDIMPKEEEVVTTALARHAQDMQLQQQQQHLQHLQQQQASAATTPFFGNFAHAHHALSASATQLSLTQQQQLQAQQLQQQHHQQQQQQQQQAAQQQQQQQQCSPVMMNRFRRRGERMSKDQKELYVKYFEENPCMLTQRRNDHMLEPYWQKLAAALNSVPQGAVKNVEEWKQTFDAWRYRVFMYTRYNSKLSGVAAQSPKNYKPLTSTDQRAYAMWTSHKGTAPQDFDKMDMFAHLEETQADYDYARLLHAPCPKISP